MHVSKMLVKKLIVVIIYDHLSEFSMHLELAYIFSKLIIILTFPCDI